MAFSLTKAQQAEKERLTEALRVAKSSLDTAVSEANAQIEEAETTVNSRISEYNAALTGITDFIEEHKDKWQEAYDEKSETWQEGDKGEAVAALLGEWDNYDGEAVEEISIGEIEIETEHLENFEALPIEAEAA